MSKTTRILLVILTISFLVGCGGGGGGSSSSGAGTEPTLVSLAITPTNPTVPQNASEQFAATGTYSDNSTADVTASAQWTSSSVTVASVGSSAGSYGLASSLAAGTSTITASVGSISGTTTLTVTSTVVTATDLANAKAAKLSASFDGATKVVALTWSDTFSPSTNYAIEQQAPGGTWTLIDSVPGTTGTGSPLSWTHAANVTTTLRVAAQKAGYEVPLQTPSGNTSLQVTVPTTPPTILLDQAQPVTGTVNVSISGGGTYSSVAYYADLNLVGTSTTGPTYSVPLNTAGLRTGPHLLLARLATSPDSYLEVRQTIQVVTPSVAVQMHLRGGYVTGGQTGNIEVDVSATSSYGVTSVTVALDGASIGTLTAPNSCGGSACGGYLSVYEFAINTIPAGSGPHTITATATDGNGSVASATIVATFNNPPILTLTSPIDGALVNGTLPISGTFSTDKATATVSLIVTLGGLPVLNTTSSPFSTSFSLAGVVPGTYTLTATASDNTGASTVVTNLITVTSSPSLVYTPLFTLPSGGQVLAAEGPKVLYSIGDGAVLLRDVAMSNEITLTNAAAIQYVTGWEINGGRVVAYGKGTDCVLYCVYLWAADGSVTNLTNPNPYSRAPNIGGGWAYDLQPVIRGDYIVWVNGQAADTPVITDATGRYTVYKISAGTYTRIGVPNGVIHVGDYDFAVVNSVVNFYFWGQTGGDGMTATFDIFKWQSDTGVSTRLTQGGVRNLYVQTDGVRAAWQESPVGVNADNTFTLMTLPVAGGATTSLAAKATSFWLKDGVLAWVESTATNQAVKASTLAGTATLSILSNSRLYGSSGGFVVWAEQGKVYSWNSATAANTLRIDLAPNQIIVTGSTMYFTVGQAVYRVALN